MILILSFYCKVMTFQSLESLIYIHKLGQREVKLKCYSPVKEYNLAYSLSSIEVEQPKDSQISILARKPLTCGLFLSCEI